MSEKKQFHSTQLLSGEYFPDTRKLRLTFRQGKNIYEYDNIGPEIWQGLCGAESAGRFFHKVIRMGLYPYRKLPKPIQENQGGRPY